MSRRVGRLNLPRPPDRYDPDYFHRLVETLNEDSNARDRPLPNGFSVSLSTTLRAFDGASTLDDLRNVVATFMKDFAKAGILK